MCKSEAGEVVPTPTLSFPPSTKNIPALPLLSILKSASTLLSLNTVLPVESIWKRTTPEADAVSAVLPYS